MLLSVNNIRKQFQRSADALTDASFSVGQGEFVSVIGSSGAGKTTLFRILNGSLRNDGGTVLLDGIRFDNASSKERRRLQKRIGTIYQDFALVENTSCLQNVLNACLPDMGFLSSALGLFGKERTEKALCLLEKVGIKDKAYEPVKNLSGGQKQRVAIARALMREPAILLADEPVASLDPVTGRQILELLKQLQLENGLTILMNSHNLELSKEYSDRLIGMKAGCVVFDGPADTDTEYIFRRVYRNDGECSESDKESECSGVKESEELDTEESERSCNKQTKSDVCGRKTGEP